MKRYGISLLPKNFFKGGSFYKKGRGGDREGGGGVGRGGGRGEIKSKIYSLKTFTTKIFCLGGCYKN